ARGSPWAAPPPPARPPPPAPAPPRPPRRAPPRHPPQLLLAEGAARRSESHGDLPGPHHLDPVALPVGNREQIDQAPIPLRDGRRHGGIKPAAGQDHGFHTATPRFRKTPSKEMSRGTARRAPRAGHAAKV